MPTLSRKLTGSVEKVITTFAASWKNALRDTDKEIVQLFSNYRQVGFSHEVSWLVNSSSLVIVAAIISGNGCVETDP